MAQTLASAARRLIAATVGLCLRYRVTGLAAEVGFFTLLSLPPLVLALAASAAWVGSHLSGELQLEAAVSDFLAPLLTPEAVDSLIVPTLRDALNTPRYDVISLGFLLALWSGSRALHTYVESIAIMHGAQGHRGLMRSRLFSFGLYLGALALGAIALPLILIGPGLLQALLPIGLQSLAVLYWPVVAGGGVLALATLLHLGVPVRSRWWRSLPGAVLALVIWLLTSGLLRLFLAISLSRSQSGTRSLSIYGPLTTPIVLLIWLYLLAIAVLVGAAFNAAIEQLWPTRSASAGEAQ